MSLVLKWVAYGRPAAEALHAGVVAAKRDDPLRPVTIVVPTNYVGVSVRRLLASARLGPVSRAGAGLAGVTLLTVYRLAELLGAPRLSAAGRRPVSTPVIAAAVRQALRAGPGRFAPVADHPATEAALVRAHRELSSLSAEGLRRLEAQGERAADVVRVHRWVAERLAADWYEETDLMAAATDALRGGSPLVADLGAVLVYLPQELSRPAATLLRAVAEHVPVEVLAGCTGVEAADAEVRRSVTRLGVDRAPPSMRPPVATEVQSVSDADEELRAAVRRIVAALRDGAPLERMALLYPAAQPYARLAHEHLTAAGVPYNGTAVRPLADRLLGRWLLDLLGLGDGGYRRQDVFDLLASAPTYLASGRRVPTAHWERVSRAAGVVRGRDDWSDKLASFARQQRAEADRAEADEGSPEWLADRLRREAGDAETLRGFVLELIGALEAGAGQHSWSGLVRWARGLVERYLGGEGDRAGWPEIER
ncbi:MAG: PD-(D/E)XK nuclease family protein, partial [Actinomycetota bacterium]|nr:PD-(D/E)XK nuclease family protein [Actinomycetota bacterium]